jgi:thiol-disulfide isomerase/thioredoxin
MTKLIKNGIIALALIIGLSAFASAQEMMKKETEKPTVAIIKASWCPACRKLDPVMAKLMTEYKDKLNFIVFDVSDDAASKASMKMAEEKGLSKFFGEYKEKTSTVAIFKGEEKLFVTKYNSDRDEYIKEFEKALK